MARWFPAARISHIHGKPRRAGKFLVIPMYHPAAALHQPSLRQEVVDDFRRLPQFLGEASQALAENSGDDDQPAPEQPQQLSLF
jgi:DNA polymerase